MGATVAIVNQKGGVGKTTVTLGLTSAAAARGDMVLVVDCDPQANATWALGVDPGAVVEGTESVIRKPRAGVAAKAIVESAWGSNVHVLPASSALAAREGDLGKKNQAARLRTSLNGIAAGYDIVLIDCSPAVGALTINALTAADLALIVVEPAALSVRGITGVSDLIDTVWADFNPTLDLAGVIMNRVPPNSTEAAYQEDQLLVLLGKSTLWRPDIPQRTVLSEATGLRSPIHATGARGAEIAQIFDRHYQKLRKLSKATVAVRE
jgi:chromosome partitioning protein